MNVEHEKLLRDLYVTWDITDGVTERDFGFVRCGPGRNPLGQNLSYPVLTRVGVDGQKRSLFRIPYEPAGQFEENLPEYLQSVFQYPWGKLSDPERLDSRIFRLDGLAICCPGPIGVLMTRGALRTIITFNDRYEAAT